MEKIPVTLTLIYQDNSRFIVGEFEDEAAALVWLTEEQTRPYWQNTTTWDIV